MKKYCLNILAFLALALSFGFIFWALIQHGTIGLIHVDGLFKVLFVILGSAGILLIPSMILRAWSSSKNHEIILRTTTVLLVCLIVFNTVIPLGALIFTCGSRSDKMSNVQPQLLLGYGTGKYGVPNMMLVNYSNDNLMDYGKVDPGEEKIVNPPRSGIQNKYLMTDLLPGTEYWYRFNDGNKYYFKTPEINEENIHLAVGSDAHFGAGDNRVDITKKILTQLSGADDRYDYFFSLGDNVEYGFRDSMWNEVMSAYSSNLFTIPTGFIAGNHDAMFTGLSRYEKYCRPGTSGTLPDADLWYRVDTGRVHFLILDVEWSAESYPDEQAAWLEEQLSEIPSGDWKIVLSHGFYYSSGSSIFGWNWYDNQETIGLYSPIFEKYGVDMVFSGHNHQMELLQHSGVTYIIDGGLGGQPDSERTYISPASLWYTSGQYGFTDVTVESNIASIVFRDADGHVLKEYILTK